MNAKAVRLDGEATITVTWRSSVSWNGNGDRFLGNDSRFVFYRILYFGGNNKLYLNLLLMALQLQIQHHHLPILRALFGLFGYVLLFLIPQILFAQQPTKQIMKGEQPLLADRTISNILLTKTIPKNITPIFLWGIKAYPELHDVTITIKYKNIRSAGVARPTLGSLLRTKSNRKYKIFVNQDERFLGNAIFDKLPHNAKIGLIAHELAHILEYSKKSSLSLIGNGFLYILSKSYRTHYEGKTDDIVINRGFGWQIYDFTNYIMNYSTASKKYKKLKDRHYKSPEDLLIQITNHPLYKNK